MFILTGKVGEFGLSSLSKTWALDSTGSATEVVKGHERHRQQGAGGEPDDGEGDEEEELRRRGHEFHRENVSERNENDE